MKLLARQICQVLCVAEAHVIGFLVSCLGLRNLLLLLLSMSPRQTVQVIASIVLIRAVFFRRQSTPLSVQKCFVAYFRPDFQSSRTCHRGHEKKKKKNQKFCFSSRFSFQPFLFDYTSCCMGCPQICEKRRDPSCQLARFVVNGILHIAYCICILYIVYCILCIVYCGLCVRDG